MNAIITKYYYIIKVTCNCGKLTYYKIGEGKTKSRPNTLIEKYKKLRSSNAELLLFEELPHTEKKRLNDSLIHDRLDPAVLKHADPIYIEHYLAETDGSSEFFEVVGTMTDSEVVDFVKATVAAIKAKDYRIENKFNYTLHYNKDKYHLVNNEILEATFAACPEVEDALFGDSTESNILLIGQFDFDFISYIAYNNNVYIWHDTEENKHKFSFSRINSKIHYVENLTEVINLEISFKTIVANTPYGKTGAIINDTVRAEVDWEYFVSLFPIKDMKDAGLDACGYLDMTRVKPLAPHVFPDADILPHIMIFTKTKNATYNSMQELYASSYTVDKPFVKFMKANVLKTHYAFDNVKMWTSAVEIDKSFIYHLMRTQSQHTCGMDLLDTVSIANSYNLENTISVASSNTICTKAGNSNYKAIQFNTALEKQNFVEFYKNNRNFINRMIANQFIGIRYDGACWPKVDWTRDDWTVEKILKAVAGYTDEEVQAVLDTMNKDYYVSKNDDLEKLFGEYINEIK